MSDTPFPSRIGPYPIEREVGRGGMGIVYLARDTRLDRPVAIKVLPDVFASDPDRLARFEREARLLASLSHPNIAAIFGLEESDGHRFLVLEYVEGETLAQRLARGPLPIDDAVDVCRQIAAALETAHEGGVIHRDLKPGNVKLTPGGEVKVLDFGLAKGGAGAATSDPSLSASPTLAVSAATGMGVILGTAAYMSPEQARGRVVDRRTDIWSFGCVLYECLTAKQAFAGETVSDMIAMILQGEPDWSALPASLPPRLRDLMARCLTKDAKKRLRDIGEARLVLEGGEVSAASGIGIGAAATAAPARPASRWPLALAGVFAITTLGLGALMLMRAPERPRVLRLALPVPPTPIPIRDAVYPSLSPDGTVLVSTAADSAGGFHLWIRRLDGTDGRILPGTEDGATAFWSPDGRYLTFATQDKLKKLDLRGGSPEVLCPVSGYGRGGSWGSRDVIVFAAGSEGPLFRISKDGGTPEAVSDLDSTETGHRFPRFLPDGRHFLYASMPPRALQYTIYVGSIDAKKRERLMTADGTPVYVEPGYLLYTRNGRIVAHRFDAGARKLLGEPMPLEDEPQRTSFLGSPSLVASARGPLVYYRNAPEPARFAWFDRSGRETGRLPIPAGPYEGVEISPDGQYAVAIRRSSANESDLWMLDLRRTTVTRFTHGPGRVDRPTWSSDGKRIAFASDRDGHWDIYEKSVGGADTEIPIVKGGSAIKYPGGWLADGQTLVFERLVEKTGWDIYTVASQGDRTPRPLVATSFNEQYTAPSPDGRWIAYSSNESGRNEIYVQAVPGLEGKRQITESGGLFPSWRSDGREIFCFSGPNGVFIGMGPDGRPENVQRFEPPSELLAVDPAPDLSRVLGLVRDTRSRASNDLTIVLNWREELRRRGN